MDKKIINMFPGKIIIQNPGEKYSDLLKNFIKPFEKDFPKTFDAVDAIKFAQQAWNLGCISQFMPEEEFEKNLSDFPSAFGKKESKLLKKMIQAKKNEYAQYDRFISEFKLEPDKNGMMTLTVLTEDKDSFIANHMNDSRYFEDDEDDFNESDYEQGFINRTAIIVKPVQPFYEWVISISPGFPVPQDLEPMIYLIEEDINDFDKWLRKNSERLFQMALEGWTTNKKQWPQKRSYKMFREWFKVDIATMVYDMEFEPIYKEV